MSRTNNTLNLNKKQYRHLTYDDRVKIQTLLEQKDENGKRLFNNSYIANHIGVHRSTISREINKRKQHKMYIRTGKTKTLPYTASYANNDAKFKRGLSKGVYKLRKFKIMAKFIENKIKIDKWAPDVIIGYMKSHAYFKKDGFCKITTPTIYNAIRLHIINVKLEDTRRMKFNPDYDYKEKTNLSLSKIPYSIESRPVSIDKRLYFGHFELDTIIGKKCGKHECLMTLTERKTRFEIIFKLKGKTSTDVVDKFTKLKNYLKCNYNKIFKSLTTDNGSEFSDFLSIIKDTNTKIYFCHPYCSGEKGTNERHNGMIRYFIPKGTLIENYSNKDINKIAYWMNNYPRKILGYKTPLEALIEDIKDKTLINKILNLQDKLNSI